MTAFKDVLQQIEEAASHLGRAPHPAPNRGWDGWIAAMLENPARPDHLDTETVRAAGHFAREKSEAARAADAFFQHLRAAAIDPEDDARQPQVASTAERAGTAEQPLDLERELAPLRLSRMSLPDLAALRRSLARRLHPDLADAGHDAAARAEAMARVNVVIDAQIRTRRLRAA